MTMKTAQRLALVALVILLAWAFFAWGGPQWLTLEGLKTGLDQFAAWKNASPVLLGLVFGAAYVLVTALSLPGAVIMTLAAGAIFGLFWGTVIASFASTLGATLAFWSARYLLRDWVQARFGDRLKPINEGMARDGAFYLFTLRLVPVFPFFVINLLMGLVPIRSLTFYGVSQVGMLAGTLVYVNAGTQLAQINSLAGIVSPGVMLSFVLLGVFPLVAKAALGWLQRRRVYAGHGRAATTATSS